VRQQRHLVNGNVKQRRAAARSGEWAQHFSNASCLLKGFRRAAAEIREAQRQKRLVHCCSSWVEYTVQLINATDAEVTTDTTPPPSPSHSLRAQATTGPRWIEAISHCRRRSSSSRRDDANTDRWRHAHRPPSDVTANRCETRYIHARRTSKEILIERRRSDGWLAGCTDTLSKFHKNQPGKLHYLDKQTDTQNRTLPEVTMRQCHYFSCP